MKKLIAILFIFITTSFASALTDQEINAQIQNAYQIIKSSHQTAISQMDIARMANNSQMYQLAAYEKQYHEQMYAYLQRIAANPSQLHNPQIASKVRNDFNEYVYRTHHRDYRPYEQIQGNLQQWLAQRQWETTTAEGQQAYNNRQQQNWNAFYAHQNQVKQANANFDNYMNGLKSAQLQREKNHHQYVNTIYDRYEYVNPNTGQSYMYPNTQSQYPTVQNPDGTYTQLIPYQNY